LRGRLVAILSVLPLAEALPAPADAAEPIRIGFFQLTLGGDVSGSLAGKDSVRFNETEYGRSLLRVLRLGLCGELKMGAHLAVLAETRSENLEAPRLYALYLRARPWQNHAFDVQAGMVPPVFGAFVRRYGTDSALIGYPLAYHYPTLLRPDSFPRDVPNLLRWRGSGWRVRYPVGSHEYDHGLPLITALRWDTGIQARLVAGSWQLSGAVTQGTLSNPLVRDDNGSKQLSSRIAWRSSRGLEAGVSFARGGYVSQEIVDRLPAARGRDFRQQAVGLDFEQDWGHWILRGEGMWSGWDAVAATPPLLGTRLSAGAVTLEARFRPWPGVTLAARYDQLAFGDVLGPDGPASWDAPVSRLEVGAGYALRHNLTLKVSYQRNRRDGGSFQRGDFVAVQGSAWF